MPNSQAANKIARIKASDARADSVYDALFNYSKVLNDQVAAIRDQITQNLGVAQKAERNRLEDLLKQVQRTSKSVTSAIEKVAPSLGFEP